MTVIAIAPVAPRDARSYLDMIGFHLVARQSSAHECYLPRRKNGNVQALLAAYELTMDNIVSTTVFFKDMNEFTKMNDVYE
jgi:hypothetical protein